MRLWRVEQLAAVDAALDNARAGTAWALAITGPPGSGKTALLDEILDRASDFVVLTAEGVEGDTTGYAVLHQWGIRLDQGTVGAGEPFVVAQAVRALVDACGDAPLLLVLDDLQWADPSSVDAVVWVLRRSLGDRLLVVAASRPPTEEQHPAWRRWVGARSHATELELTGLTVDQVLELMAQRTDRPARAVAESLIEHTDGNPLYLRALLDEYDVDDLAARQVLPAPAPFARTVAARSARLSPEGVRLLHTLAVLGSSWQPLATVLAVAQSPADSVDELVDAGFALIRPGPPDQVRIEHALVAAAVHQLMPVADRKARHRSAAELVGDEGLALDHRVAAATTYDDDLAEALAAHAQQHRDHQAWRCSARYFRAASTLTTDQSLRRLRLMESLFDRGLALETGAVQAELAERPPSDDPAELVVRGLVEIKSGRPGEGRALLARVIADDTVTPLQRYRALVLSAWAALGSQAPAEVHALLQNASSLGVHDAGTAYHYRITKAMTDQRLMSPEVHWASLDHTLGRAAAVPLARSLELAERAIVAVRVGLFEVAQDDMAELMGRVRSGVITDWDPRLPSGLGYVQWLLGDWVAARRSLHLAADVADERAYLPLLLSGEARFEEADALISLLRQDASRSGDDIRYTNLLVALAVRGHADGSWDLREALAAEEVDAIEETLRVGDPRHAMWSLSAGVISAWARRDDLVDGCARRLEAARPQPRWAAAVAFWLRGLAADLRHEDELALELIGRAAQDRQLNLPLFRAHMLVDHGELSALAKQPKVAATSLAEAERIYRDLGAHHYLARLAGGWPQAAQPARRTDIVITVSDRERDVLALLVNGMSYAQIASELFITQKTVGYHLSNLYAKTHVSGRHELAELARRDPEIFQLALVEVAS